MFVKIYSIIWKKSKIFVILIPKIILYQNERGNHMNRFLIILFLCFVQISLFGSLQLKKIKTLPTDYAPKSIVISPDGKIAYSMNLEGMSVYAFDTQTKELLWKLKFIPTAATGWDYSSKKPISSYAEKPVEAAFSSNGRYLLVSLHNDESIVVIDTHWQTQFTGDTKKARLFMGNQNNKFETITVKHIKVGKTPKVIAVSPDDRWAYVANWHSHTVSVIDTHNWNRIKDIKVTHIPRGMAFSPDGNYCYIGNMGDYIVTKVDVKNNHQVVKNYTVGLTPRHLAISSDGRFLYISLNSPGQVVKFDTQAEKVIKTVYVGSNPRTLALSPDGKYIFVVEYYNHSLSLLDANSMEILEKYKTGINPVGVAVLPNGKEVWVVNYAAATIDIFQVVQ